MILSLLLFLGCTKGNKPRSNAREDVPILPSPVAGQYIVGSAKPRDFLVAQVAKELPWDESLSGAAAKIGLDFGASATLGEARWAATQAQCLQNEMLTPEIECLQNGSLKNKMSNFVRSCFAFRFKH